MILITGDTHGDITRFKDSKLRRLKKNDYFIICGDFGFIWDNSRHEQTILKKLSNMKYNILFVDGCHENFDTLNSLEVQEWNGGKVHFISDNIIHLMRGQVYEIDGKKIFTMGGGRSQDIDIRREAGTWYESEIPSADEIMEGFKNLEKCGNKVDYIITHEPPGFIKNCFNDMNMERLEADKFFENIIEKCEFRNWYFGKCHTNRIIPQNFYALFDYIIPVE
ncbi:MAG: metallophosphoesterase [Oscillospiraceae bacterium]